MPPVKTRPMPVPVPVPVQVPTNPNQIAVEVEIVDISTLVPDPENARLHPERNLEAIIQSLTQYGQVKPLVVRRETNVVVAGNGTLEAAISLGWDKIAVNYVDMTAVEAAGYGLADNRTAELATWNLEVMKRIERLLEEEKHPNIGWTLEELEILRTTDWVPPVLTDPSSGSPNGTGIIGDAVHKEQLVVGFTPDQYEVISTAVAKIRERSDCKDIDQSEALWHICAEWLEWTKE